MAGNVFAKSMATRLIISRSGVPVEERVFDDEIVTIGSDPGASLCLTDPSIAPEQAIVIREDGRPLLINRAPGTVFNGELLPREAQVSPLLPFYVGAVKNEKNKSPTAVAVAKFRHTPYDTVAVVSEKVDGRWQVVSIASVVDH